MKKTQILVAGAIGYVLGARAGRERYEQIRSGARQLARNPRVQAAKGRATDVAKEKAGEAAHAAADKVRQIGRAS
jgi:hypothetical protein